MKNIVHSYARKFREERRKSRRAVALLLALALVVSTGVTWQLHSTGIALTNETYCGLEEHTHTEDCYEEVLVCGMEESEGHTHTDACYETESVLVCGKAESEGHTHTESCYDEEGNLTCGKEESEGHTHTDACYETKTTLVCGQEESEGHTHTEDCYEEQLTCGKEEHTHTVDCLTDETADVETASDWEATLPALTGEWGTDVAAIAKSQLGYTESTANFTLADDGTTRKGYTRYGAWYGNEYGDWDAMFASFCLYYAGVDEEAFSQGSGAYAWTVALSELGLYDEDAEPTNGDLVFFDTDKDGKADHVGVVAGVSDYKVTVIEGDSDDKVQSTAYSLNDSTITGYGVLPEQEAETETETETTTLTYEGEDYTVTATYGADAELPEGVELIATEYAKDSENYLARYAEAAELNGWSEDEDYTDSFRLFCIGFYVNGEEVEPAAEVQVTISYLNQENEVESYTVTHYGDEGTETLDSETAYADGTQTTSFASDSFSEFSLTAGGGGSGGGSGGGGEQGGGDQGGGDQGGGDQGGGDQDEQVEYEEGHYYHIDIRTAGTFTYSTSVSEEDVTTASVTVNKVWDDDNSEDRPESVTVYLMYETTDENGDTVTSYVLDDDGNKESVELSESNSWTYTWTDLDLNTTYVVEEEAVSGYESSSTCTVNTTEDTEGSDTEGNSTTGTIDVTSINWVKYENEDGEWVTLDATYTKSVAEDGSGDYEWFSSVRTITDLLTDSNIQVNLTYTYSYKDENGITQSETVTVTVDMNASSTVCAYKDNTDTMAGVDLVITGSLLTEGVIQNTTTKITTYTITNTLSDYDITIVKKDYTDAETTLAGATFTLDGTKYTTNEDGEITINGLSNGTYTLTETAAPDGYNLLNGTITITIKNGEITCEYDGNDGNEVTVSDSNGSIVVTVTNIAGTVLPSTGGSGTWMYTLAGLTLCGGAALVLFRRKETE